MTKKEKEKAIDELLSRGVERVFPNVDSLKKELIHGKKLRLYCGFDPSAPSLHIGNAILINKLHQFQELGHEVIFLIGDFTGMIGDPTDKSAVRKKLTREEVLENAKTYKEQASGYIDFDGENPAKILYNSEWNDNLSFVDVIELASNFTVQQMLDRDMFEKRIQNEKPIYLHEFLYPLTQGYDSVAMDVDLEIGGNDQMFNMLVGRDLMKIIKKKEKFVLTVKLLADDTGKKMGKTEGNAVFLDQLPHDMYGAIMSWTDDIIISGFELATMVPMKEIERLKKQLDNGMLNPRDAKMRLAFEITKINHGEEKALAAQEYFVKTFSKKETPSDVKRYNTQIGIDIVELLVSIGGAISKSDARRKITQGGVSIGKERITDTDYKLQETDDRKILKVGKRFFVKLIM